MNLDEPKELIANEDSILSQGAKSILFCQVGPCICMATVILDGYTQIRHYVCMKRTNIVLDEELIGKGMRLTGISTQRSLIDYALRELVRRKEQKKILRLKGHINWVGDLDEMRTNRF